MYISKYQRNGLKKKGIQICYEICIVTTCKSCGAWRYSNLNPTQKNIMFGEVQTWRLKNVLCTSCRSIQQAKEDWTWRTHFKGIPVSKEGFGTPLFGMFQNSDARKCLFLTKKNRFRASLFWDIPICETSIQRGVFYLKNFPLNGGFKINGCSKPFFRSFFWPWDFVFNRRVKKRSLETQLLSKPTFKGKFSICWL